MAMSKAGVAWKKLSKKDLSEAKKETLKKDFEATLKGGKELYINIKIESDIKAGSLLQLYTNDFKLSDKHPDYNVVVVTPLDNSANNDTQKQLLEMMKLLTASK